MRVMMIIVELSGGYDWWWWKRQWQLTMKTIVMLMISIKLTPSTSLKNFLGRDSPKNTISSKPKAKNCKSYPKTNSSKTVYSFELNFNFNKSPQFCLLTMVWDKEAVIMLIMTSHHVSSELLANHHSTVGWPLADCQSTHVIWSQSTRLLMEPMNTKKFQINDFGKK